MAGNEHQLAIFGPIFRPAQVVSDARRFTILISAEEGDVEVVARIFEIVWVTTKKSHFEFWRKNQAHIGVLLVLIQMVECPRVKGLHVAADVGSRSALLFQ